MIGDRFIPKFHLKEPGFGLSFCGPFTNYHKRTQKFREIVDLNISIKRNQTKFVLLMTQGMPKLKIYVREILHANF